MLPLPPAILQFINNNPLVANKIGQSPSDVYSFSKNGELFYLKMTALIYSNTTYSTLREAQILNWLAGKLNVPEVVSISKDHENEYMITKAVDATAIANLKFDEKELISTYQNTLQQLQSIAIQDCPFLSNIDYRLQESQFFIDHDLLDDIDRDDIDVHVWGKFQSQVQLIEYLNQNKFPEDIVSSHGDITYSKILLNNKDEIFFLDVGRAGIADQFVDITFIERCLREDCSNEAALLFLQSIPQDHAFKRDYFLKLDELN